MNGYDSICCFRNSEMSGIKSVLWEITTYCNLNCNFCHRTSAPDCQPSLDEIRYILAILKDADIKKIIISGGEPFYRVDITEIIAMMDEYDFEIDLCTNATLLNQDKIDRISHILSEISVSIDSYDSKIHDNLRGKKGCWTAVVKGIELLKKAEMEIHVISLLTKSNIHTAEKTVDFLRSLNVHSVSFIGHIPVGTGENPITHPDAQDKIKRTFSLIRTKNPDFPINTKQLIINDGTQTCFAGKKIFGVCAENYLYPCILRRQGGGINLLSSAKEDILKVIKNNSLWPINKVNLGEGICPGSLYINGE